MFRKLSLILVLAFLITAGNTQAAQVYWKPNTGSDSGTGTSTSSAVKTLAKAIEVLKLQYQENPNPYPSADWIIIQMESWVIGASENSEIVIDGKIDATHNALVLRDPNMKNYMIEYSQTTSSGANTLKLSNITFHGNSTQNSWSSGAGNQNKPIIVVGAGRTLIMEDGCILKENYQTEPAENNLDGAGVVINSGAKLVMNGGEISNCKANRCGGGVYSAGGATFEMNGGKIDGCYALSTSHNKGEGGGVYMNAGCSFEMNGGEICNCHGGAFGGGIRLVSSDAENPTIGIITKGNIHDNHADDIATLGRGGGIEMSGVGVSLTINGAEAKISDNHANFYGGGIQTQSGAKLYLNNGTISGNIAKDGAGGVHVTGNGSTFIMNGGKLLGNKSDILGGAIHSSSGCILEIHGGEIANNEATIQAGAVNINTGANLTIDETSSSLSIHDNKSCVGGAFCVNGATLTVNGGTYYNNQALESFNSGTENRGKGRGGFVYVDSRSYNDKEYQGNFIFNSGSIYNNTATNFGGAVFVAKEDPNAPLSTSSTNQTTAEIHGGVIGMEGAGNKALNYDGGALYCQQSTNFVMDNINAVMQYNEAGHYGGGLAIGANATVTLTAGTISHNKAGNQGGGIHIPSNSTFKLSGSAVIANNDVTSPSGMGGGVYMGGSMEVYSGSLAVRGNTINGSVACNVYLPASHSILVKEANFKPDYLGIYVADGQTPPIYVLSAATANYSWLETIYNGMVNNTMNIFDDKQQYSPILRPDVAISGMKAIWFDNSSPWSLQQQHVTAANNLVIQNGVCQISDTKSLTAFLWYVNGITKHSSENEFASTHPSAKGVLTADIDMVSQYWVPIGTNGSPFSGELNGNGHIISNLVMAPTNTSTEYGLIGHTTSNAVIENVILQDCNFASASNVSSTGSLVAVMNGGTIRNCYSACAISATNSNCKTGGLVGTLTSGNLINNLSYPKLVISDNGITGGLVGINTGTVENCYVRGLQTGSAPGSNFGWLVGNNSRNVNKSYAPNNEYNYAASGTVGEYCGTFTAPKIFSHDIAHDNRVGNDRLVYLLNDYVAHTNAASKDAVLDSWILPTTTTVNGGLPVLKPSGTIAVGSTDGTALEYARNEDELVAMLNGYATGGISLYANADLSGKTVTQGNATFAIHPSVSVKQGANSANIRALVSIAMQYTSGTKYYHGISSPVASWPLGFAYGNTAQVAYNDNKNPCLAYMGIADGIFPQDVNIANPTVTSSLPWDFYDFYESTSHWVNYRRNSLSHWDEQDHDLNLGYTNHTTMQAAKGYLAALALPSDFDNDSILLQHEGMLNYGDVTVPVTNHAYAYHHGINMIGNPYESYLDFDVLASTNSALWTSGNQFYGAYDKDNGFVYYAPGASEDYPYTASRYIHKHQGFFVRLDNCAETGNSMQFTESMRTNDGAPHFRDWERNYPLVNLIVTDSEGATDVCVVEMNRPDEGGALKLVPMVMSNGVLYAHRNGNDYGIVFTDGQENVPLWFETNASENFTLTWNTRHGEFSYLHLIDNIAGADIDMLASQQYTFAANTNDYKSRFKLVCQCTGVDENADTDTEPAEAFAFVNDGQLIVNGDGLLQIFDLNGRMLQQTMLDGAMNTVSLLEMAAGLYILKLDGKAQKIVME